MNKHLLLSIGILILLSWFLIIGIDSFPYPASGEYSDFTISHYPNLIYTQQTINNQQQIPLWSNTIFSGYPFAADPLSSLWYPPYWLAIALPAPFGLNLLTILHFLMGAVGVLFFLRFTGVTDLPAFAGAVIFMLMPKLIAHYGAGHITLVWAVCITPWLLYFEHRSREASQNRKYFILTCLLAGLMILADVRWAVYGWLIWWGYSLYLYVSLQNEIYENGQKRVFRWFIEKFAQSLIGILLASPLLLPLIQFTGLSTRKLLTASDNLLLSLPPTKIFGSFFPDLGGNAEWISYIGAIPIILFISALVLKKLRTRTKFWLLVVVVSAIVSLGSNLPGFQVITKIPIFNLLRVPSRALLAVGIGMTMISAECINFLIKDEGTRTSRYLRLTVTAIMTLVISLTLVFALNNTENQPGILWGGLSFTLSGLILLSISLIKPTRPYFFVLLISLLVLDLSFTSFSMLRFEKKEKVLSQQIETIDYIQSKMPLLGRIYSPSYSVPQEIGPALGLQQVDGINPLQLMSYVNFMEKATGVISYGYSVTLPAYSTASPNVDNINATPDSSRLGLLNVAYIVSAFPITTNGLLIENTFDNTYIYKNKMFRPRAWVQSSEKLDADESYAPADVNFYSPNRILITALGPGILILADPYYPGWYATVDGKPTPILEIGQLLRGVSLSSGKHEVQFLFHPQLLFIGILLQIITIMLLGWFQFIHKGIR